MKQRYKISVNGCDDSTEFVMDLDEAEAALIMKVAEICTNTSTYGCMPTMDVELLEEQR